MKTKSADSDTQPELRIQLLGGFGVWVNGDRIGEDQLHSRRVRKLVKLLALAPGHRLHRDQIIDTLWPDSDLGAAANNFHQTLHAARKALCPAGEGWLVLENGFLDLWHGNRDKLDVDVDVERFEAAAAALTGTDPPPEDYQAVLSLYPGNLLPEDPYEEWTIAKREALRGMYLDLLLGLAAAYERRQEYPAGIEALRKLLERDPSSEDAHAGLMRLLAKNGQRREALRQYETLKEHLRQELDVEPSHSTHELYQAIHSGRLSPLPELAMPGHNLPAEMTSFIGREQEIASLKSLLLSGKTRLVTVSGAGGVGKTRLALRAAEELLEAFSEKVRYVDLVRVTDPDLVAGAALKVMGLRESPHRPPIETLVEFLREMRYLLVLDNCEHVIQATAELAEALLRGCPRLVILATSRELLKVTVETAYRCPSLRLPEEPQPGLLESADQQTGECESVRLFIERAAQSVPSFNLNERKLPPVVQICRHLDGIPLAIEMAAARLRVLSMEQIAGRLDQIFLMLNEGMRTELPRHQTLKAAIDWPYDLLSNAEKALLGRLAVFVGGWTLDAAEAICSDEGKLKQADILNLIGQLVDKSLVIYEQEGDLDPHYRMLEPVRQYARDRLLESGDEPELHQRHLEYFTALAEEAKPHLRAWGMVEWLARLGQELGNMRPALEWALAHSAEPGLRLAAALREYWHVRVHEVEGISWLMKFLAEDEKNYSQQPRSQDALCLYCKGLIAVGFLKIQNTVGQAEEGYALIALSAKLLTEVGQKEVLYFRNCQGFHAEREDQHLAMEIISEVHQNSLSCGDKFRAGECLYRMTQLHLCFGNLNQAKVRAEENYAIRRELGDIDGEAFSLLLLALVAMCDGNLAKAEELNRASQAGFLTISNYQYYYEALFQNAFFILLRGNYAAARQYAEMWLVNEKEKGNLPRMNSFELVISSNYCLKDFEQCERWCLEAQRSNFNPDIILYYLGMIRYSCGDFLQAAACMKNFRFVRSDFSKFKHLQGLGIVTAAVGLNRRAVVLFGALYRVSLGEQYRSSHSRRPI